MSRGYFIEINPLRGRLTLGKQPMAKDPIWQRMAPGDHRQPEIDTLLVERCIPVMPENGRVRVRLIQCREELECFAGEQVALTYRLYEQTRNMFGLFVQEGAAEFRNFSIRSLRRLRVVEGACVSKEQKGWPE